MSADQRGYSDYLDSGVKWIGSVPAHWTPLKFKRVLSEKKHTSNPNLPAGSISFGRVVYKDSETLAEATKASYQEVLPDEFLVNPLNLNFDLKSLRTALSDIAVVVSTGYIVLRSGSRLDKRFTRWLLQEFDVAHMKTLGAGVRQTISFTDIGNSIFFAPPLEEQAQIAKFLDYETAKIDALIEKQQRLIALLKEKRQAVISHAVTKGLDPDAPMRDSGVEWLGEVPAHWRVLPLKYLCGLLKDGTHLPPSRVSEGVPLLSVRNLQDSRFGFRDDDSQISEASYQELCRSFVPAAGDVFLAIVGATLGKVAVVPEMGRFHIQRSLACMRPVPSVLSSHYLAGVLSSSGFQDLLWANVGFSAQPGIYLGTIENFRIPVPTIEEQGEIIDEVEAKTAVLNNLVDKAECSVVLMQERRTALISAAVTGKIDVRGWKAPDSEPKAEVA